MSAEKMLRRNGQSIRVLKTQIRALGASAQLALGTMPSAERRQRVD